MAKLVERNSGQEHLLREGTTRIGRRSSNEIQVNEKQVSRLHCRIEGRGGGWRLSDADSTAGTVVNQRRVRQCHLQAGDVIRVGSVELIFEDGEPPAPVPLDDSVRPLTETAAGRLVPYHEDEEPDVPPPRRRRRLWPVLVGGSVAAAAVGALALVVWLTRQTPQKAVRRAAEMLCRRDADGLWQLAAAEHKDVMTREEFTLRIEAVPNAVVEAVRETLQLGRPYRDERGVVVPVEITVRGEPVRDEVVLVREDGYWRIRSVPARRVEKLGR